MLFNAVALQSLVAIFAASMPLSSSSATAAAAPPPPPPGAGGAGTTSRTTYDADVLVIGVGPVGAFGSLLLSSHGLDVVAFDSHGTEVYPSPRAVAWDEPTIRAAHDAGGLSMDTFMRWHGTVLDQLALNEETFTLVGSTFVGQPKAKPWVRPVERKVLIARRDRMMRHCSTQYLPSWFPARIKCHFHNLSEQFYMYCSVYTVPVTFTKRESAPFFLPPLRRFFSRKCFGYGRPKNGCWAPTSPGRVCSWLAPPTRRRAFLWR